MKRVALWGIVALLAAVPQAPAQTTKEQDEHAKALYYLYKVFKELRPDSPHAAQCRDILEKDKQFAGTEYQKLIASEK